MHLGRAQRIGRLERMPPLDAAPTRATLPNVDLKPADVWLHDRQLFLDLIGDTRLVERSAARRAARRQRHVDRFVNVGRRMPMAVAPVPATSPPTWRVRMRYRRALRKRRGLPLHRTTRQVEFLLQSLDLASQPVVFPFDAFPLRAFPIPVALGALGAFTPITLTRVVVLGHAAFMADSRKLYKYKMLDSAVRPARVRHGPANQLRKNMSHPLNSQGRPRS
jgi:hypothetical protein